MTSKRVLLIVVLSMLGGFVLCGLLLYGLAGKIRSVALNQVEPSAVAPGMAGRAEIAQDKMLSTGNSFMPAPVPDAAPTDTQQRLIVKNGAMTMVVKQFQPAIDQVTQIAKNQGGYVTDYTISQDETVPPIDVYPGQPIPLQYKSEGRTLPQPQLGMATVSVRVPADKLDATMQQLAGVGVRVVSQSVNGDDVTDQFVDLEARLKTLQNTEAQLQKILSQATTTADTLAVYTQLSQIQSQIEQLQGQMNFLNQSVKLSQITVTMRQDQGAVVTNRIESWQPVVVAREALNALVNAFKGVGDLVIWIAVFSPIWLPLAVLGWYLYRRFKRRQMP